MPRLPTFLIAGAMRCGTTSLNSYLREHPEVSVSRPKEVHFFDNNYEAGVDWYLEHFPGSDDSRAVGEATPDYLYEPEAAARIAATLPDVKILLLLRDPVDRALSHYWHNRSVGREDLSFWEALSAEDDRLAESPEWRARYSYLDRGRYAMQIERFLEHIPRQRILVQTFDDLTTNTVDVYRRTCRFIGVDEEYLPENLGAVANAYVEYRWAGLRDAAKRLPRTMRNLVALFNRKDSGPYSAASERSADYIRERTQDDNAALSDLVGVDPPWARVV